MKVIFLDFDGVLNSMDDMGNYVHLNNSKVLLLQDLVKQTDAEIVISSTWRRGNTLEELKRALWWTGLRSAHKVFDITDSNGKLRGEEIQRWLDKHPEVTKYVILDDDGDMLESQKNNFVHVSIMHGFNRVYLNKALEILK